jgi:hypothetical protein
MCQLRRLKLLGESYFEQPSRLLDCICRGNTYARPSLKVRQSKAKNKAVDNLPNGIIHGLMGDLLRKLEATNNKQSIGDPHLG